MIDHISISVRDLKKAEPFYAATLAPLGLTKLREWPDAAIGFGKKYPEFWINRRDALARIADDSGVHICLRAADTAAVDTFHAAGARGWRHVRWRAGAAAALLPRILCGLYPRSRRQSHRGGDLFARGRCRRNARRCVSKYGFTAAPPGPPLSFLRRSRLARLSRSFGRISSNVIGDEKFNAAGRRGHKSKTPHMIDQRQQRIPEAVDVGDQDRLLVTSKLRPGHLLDQFFQRAEAARQSDESVGAVEHRALALVHVAGNDLFLRQLSRPLLGGQEFRE